MAFPQLVIELLQDDVKFKIFQQKMFLHYTNLYFFLSIHNFIMVSYSNITLRKPLLIIMTKWPGYGRCKTRLAIDIGENNALRIHNSMFWHTLAVAKYLENNDVLEISLAISGIGLNKSKRWCDNLGIRSFNLQGSGSLGERMKRQLLINNRKKQRHTIIIGTDLPDLCHLNLIQGIKMLDSRDVILGPSDDGGYWLIGFSDRMLSSKNFYPFININWSSNNVIQETINNLSAQKINIDFLPLRIDIDTISDIRKRSR